MDFELESTGWKMSLGILNQGDAEVVAEGVYAECKTGLHRNSAIVRAAIKAGWLIDPKLSDDDINATTPPGRIGWMADCIASSFLEQIAIPKN